MGREREDRRHLGGRQRLSAVVRRKSVKRSFRNTSFGVRTKVKRNMSMNRKQRSMEQNMVNRNAEVREERSKSFIVKRKSFRKPRNWSSYIKNSEEDRDHLPRVKGFWTNQKFVRSRFYSLGKIWTEQCKRRTNGTNIEKTLTIPRPTLIIRRDSVAGSSLSLSRSDTETSSDDDFKFKRSQLNDYNSYYRKTEIPESAMNKMHKRIASKISSCLPETDSGVYSSVSGNSMRGSMNRYTTMRRPSNTGSTFPRSMISERQMIPNLRQKIAGPDYLQMSNQPRPEVATYFSDSWKISQAASWRHLILSTLPQKYSRDEQRIQRRTVSPIRTLEDLQEEELCQQFERIYQKNRISSLDRRVPSHFSIFPSGSLPRLSPTKTWMTEHYSTMYDKRTRYRDQDMELEPSTRRHKSVPPQQDPDLLKIHTRQKSVPLDPPSWPVVATEHCYTASRDQREKEVEVYKVWPERRRWERDT